MFESLNSFVSCQQLSFNCSHVEVCLLFQLTQRSTVRRLTSFLKKPDKFQKTYTWKYLLTLIKVLCHTGTVHSASCKSELEVFFIDDDLFSFFRRFYEGIRPLLAFAQWVGIMPIFNVQSPEKLKLLNWRLSFCLLLQTSFVLILCCQVYGFFIDQAFDYGKFIPVMWYINSLLISINFVQISRNIEPLLSSWMVLESKHRDTKSEESSKRFLKFFVCFGLIASFEHFLAKVEDYEVASFCFHRHQSKLEALARTNVPSFFTIFAFNHFNGVFILLISLFSTILWNFSDIFLITAFYVIYLKLQKFNRKTARRKCLHGVERFWLDTRLHFVALHDHVKATNALLSFGLVQSLLTDFYITCNQVLGAFKWVDAISFRL